MHVSFQIIVLSGCVPRNGIARLYGSFRASQMVLVIKKPPASTGDIRDVQSLSREDPLEKGMQPTPVFLLGNFHGQRSLADCSPWSHKESDRTVHNNVHNILECGCLRLLLVLQFANCATLSKFYNHVRTIGLKSRVPHSQVAMQRSLFFFF